MSKYFFYLSFLNTIPCVTGVLGKLRSGPAKHVIVGEGHRKGEEVDRGDIGSSN